MKNTCRFLTAVLLTVAIAVGLTGPAGAADQIDIGAADSFAVLGASTVTNTGLTVVNGNVGLTPGSSVTGFPPGTIVNGSIHINDAAATQARADAIAANSLITGFAFTSNLTGQDLGGMTLIPGVYRFDSSAQLTGALVLNGGPDDLFVFQIGSTLTTASNSSVILTGGALPGNVFWIVGSSATIGTGTAFQGNILAYASVTLATGSALEGRAFALNGAVTLDNNAIIAPLGDPDPPDDDPDDPDDGSGTPADDTTLPYTGI